MRLRVKRNWISQKLLRYNFHHYTERWYAGYKKPAANNAAGIMRQNVVILFAGLFIIYQ
jgi:hypothetical protein